MPTRPVIGITALEDVGGLPLLGLAGLLTLVMQRLGRTPPKVGGGPGWRRVNKR